MPESTVSAETVDAPAILCQDLHVSAGRRKVLRGVDATFRPGQLSAVIGPNGAGKSTFARTLLGIRQPSRGRLELGGQPLGTYPRTVLARLVSFIPQDTQIDFSFRVEDVVLMGRYPHLDALEPERPVDLQIVAAALAELHLTALAGRDVTTLSVGERQLAVIARALATRAPVLIADEPVASLDIGHRYRVLELLRRRATAGHTVVVVLHDLELALRFADTVVLIDDGHTAAAGPPSEVLASQALEQAFGITVTISPDGQSVQYQPHPQDS